MKEIFLGAKMKYDSVEVPAELAGIIERALSEEKNVRSNVRPLVYRYASVAACILICIMISLGYFAINENDFNAAPSETAVEAIPSGRAIDTPQIIRDNAVEEASAVTTNKKAFAEENGKITELYSDDEIFSYSVIAQPSNITKFHNIRRSDGEEITLESLVGDDSEFNSSNSVFYFKSKDELVVICDGVENIVKLK